MKLIRIYFIFNINKFKLYYKKIFELRKVNLKSLKKLKSKRSKIFKKTKMISFSLNKRDTSLEYENRKRILSIIKKYSVNENQDKLNEIL